MTTIIYDRRADSNEFVIDDIAQQIIVYLGFHGSARSETIAGAIGGSSATAIEMRLDETLGSTDAGLVEEIDERQLTIDGEETPPAYTLTDDGVDFVYRHKSVLETPTELEAIAHTVSQLERSVEGLPTQLDDVSVDQEELRETVSRLERRLQAIDDRVESLENE
jgi:hypothetical protein